MTNKYMNRISTIARRFMLLSLLFAASGVFAQTRPYYEQGQGVSAVYEGWTANDDGSFNLMFGYMNENWDEEIDVPVGANNSFSPGPADRGQPTHFLPRRNRYVFEFQVPADFGEQELVWTLVTTDGVTQKAFGSLHRDYFLDDITIMSETGATGSGRDTSPELRANIKPMVTLKGSANRTVAVGESLELAVKVMDDGLPPVKVLSPGQLARRPAWDPENMTPREMLKLALEPPLRGTVAKVVGLHFTWFVYRGDGEVSFDSPQVAPWEDTRAFQNSPWSPFWIVPEAPEDGAWTTEATFHEAGTYVLHGRADDGGLYADVEVTISVEP
ncbi:MAG: hypothetical protein JKY98_04400 [Gammaproteobacteria bacterium]|nr:hypothetical protein [Gammaproteobacteria bacterium]